VELAQAPQAIRQVDRLVLHGSGTELLSQFESQSSYGFFAVLDDDLVYPRLSRWRGTAECHEAAGLRLQSQACKGERMRQRVSRLLARRPQNIDVRKAGTQPRFKGFHIVDHALRFSA
jgi:hypothetical protein